MILISCSCLGTARTLSHCTGLQHSSLCVLNTLLLSILFRLFYSMCSKWCISFMNAKEGQEDVPWGQEGAAAHCPSAYGEHQGSPWGVVTAASVLVWCAAFKTLPGFFLYSWSLPRNDNWTIKAQSRKGLAKHELFLICLIKLFEAICLIIMYAS